MARFYWGEGEEQFQHKANQCFLPVCGCVHVRGCSNHVHMRVRVFSCKGVHTMCVCPCAGQLYCCTCVAGGKPI